MRVAMATTESRSGLGVRSSLAVYRELLLNNPQHSTLVQAIPGCCTSDLNRPIKCGTPTSSSIPELVSKSHFKFGEGLYREVKSFIVNTATKAARGEKEQA